MKVYIDFFCVCLKSETLYNCRISVTVLQVSNLTMSKDEHLELLTNRTLKFGYNFINKVLQCVSAKRYDNYCLIKI